MLKHPQTLLVTIAIIASVAGCTSTGSPGVIAHWQAPEIQQSTTALLCRISANCGDFELILLDDDRPLAEVRLGYQIVLTRGFVERAHSEAALAFVLAHEIAHVELGHQTPRSLADRLPQELAADHWAQRALCQQGLDPEHGARLLQRLSEDNAASAPSSAARETALRELHARLTDLQACPDRAVGGTPETGARN